MLVYVEGKYKQSISLPPPPPPPFPLSLSHLIIHRVVSINTGCKERNNDSEDSYPQYLFDT